MSSDTSVSQDRKRDEYSMAVRYGMAGSLVLPLSWILVPPSTPLAISIVTYACLVAATGLAIGLAELYWQPLDKTHSIVAAGLCLAFPVLGTLFFAFIEPAFLILLLPTLFAVTLISVESYSLPRLHRWFAAHSDGVLSVEIGRAVVPIVTVLLMTALVTVGVLVVNDEDRGPCSDTHTVGWESASQSTPRVSFGFTAMNDSIKIVHTGGEIIQTQRLFVELNRSSIAWTWLANNTSDEITAGDTVTVPNVENGTTLEIVWTPDDDDCRRTLTEQQV
jgi:hypothetical protein